MLADSDSASGIPLKKFLISNRFHAFTRDGNINDHKESDKCRYLVTQRYVGTSPPEKSIVKYMKNAIAPL